MRLLRGQNPRGWRLYAPVIVAFCATAVHAASPGFSTLLGGAGQEYATSVASDAAGNTYVAGLTYSPDFPVTPGALQTTFGGTCDAFVAKLGPDGKVLWSTYLGGILDDWATGVAVDSAGNVVVTGWTRSSGFPLVHAIQTSLDDGINLSGHDAFVAKLDPNGTKLLYSTLLGGARDDGANGLALDAAGNAYITGTVQNAKGFPGVKDVLPGASNGIFISKLDPQGGLVYSYFHPTGTAAAIAVDVAGNAYVTGTADTLDPGSPTQTFGPAGTAQALVFKISADGSQRLFETLLGGSVRADGMAIAVDRSGAVYIAGATTSVDFPLVRPLQSNLGARPLWRSTDGGTNWVPLDDLPFAFPQTLVSDPTNAANLYVTTSDAGLFKSVDGGATWKKSGQGIASTNLKALAIDPLHPQTLFAGLDGHTPTATSRPLYKSVDGGSTWTVTDSVAENAGPNQVLVDAVNPKIVYTVWPNVTRKSTDGGATWINVAFPGIGITTLAVDPQATGSIFAMSNLIFGGGFSGYSVLPYVWHSFDGGANWVQIPSQSPALVTGFTIDTSTQPSTVYNGLLARTVDGGITWTPLTALPGMHEATNAVAVDRTGALFASIHNSGISVSRDHGQTWNPIGSPLPVSGDVNANGFRILGIVPTNNTATLYANVESPQNSGFVTKLSADGSTIVYSTFLRGHVSLTPVSTFAGQSSVFLGQNWISSILVDVAGSVTVAGGTRANDFPTANPGQRTSGGKADIFAAKIAADGGRLTYASYFGGSQDDAALASAVDGQGNLLVAGQMWSGDFPGPNGPQSMTGFYGDAFVVKVAVPQSPVITAVLNAASYQPGIEAGSWVMIKGANLADSNPGRTWTPADFDGPGLPTSLDGVTVKIDGKPAFVEYISPTQINVQAPSDSVVGPVSVVVANHGSESDPATVQLQSAAPAFFMYYGTSNAVASRFPDYAPLGDPSSTAGTVAARPGDTVVLWGTGFGPTTPVIAAGIPVSGAPPTSTLPMVTVGGVPVPVISSVLTTGTAGLYQVTIQLPINVATGPEALQASIAGAQTPSGVTILVAK